MFLYSKNRTLFEICVEIFRTSSALWVILSNLLQFVKNIFVCGGITLHLRLP